MSETYSVEAFLKANTTGFMQAFQAAAGLARDFERNINSMDVSGLEDVGRQFEQVGDRIQESGEGIKSYGENMSKYVTLPLLAVGAGALVAATDQENALAKMRAQLGLTADETSKYGDIAVDMWKNAFGENVGEVTQAISTVKTNIQNLNDADLQKLTESAFVLNDVFEQDINASTATASVLMKTFGIEGETAYDLMTTALQRGGDFSGELLDSLREYAPQFQALGYDAEGFTAVLIAGAESGAFQLDKVGDAGKEAFLKIGDGSKATQDALTNVGLDSVQIMNDINSGGEKAQAAFAVVASAIASIEDPAAKSHAAVALLGTPLEDLGPEFQDFFATVNQDLGEFEGATARAGEAAYDTFGARFTTLMRTAADSLQPVGAVILDFAEKWLPPAIAAIERMATWFGNLSSKMQFGVVLFGGLVAAIGPVLVVFGTLIGAVGSIVSTFGVLLKRFAPIIAKQAALKAGLGFLGRAFAALLGPVGIAIAVFLTLIPVFNKLYEKNETFRTVVQTVWAAIQQVISTVVAFVSGIVQSVIGGLVGWWQANQQGFADKAMAAWNAISSLIGVAIGYIRDIVMAVVSQIQSFWANHGEFISSVASKAWSFITTTIGMHLKNAWAIISGILRQVQTLFQTVWPIISGAVKIAFALISTVVQTGIKLVFGIINTTMSLLKGDWKGAWETIKNTAKNIMDGIINTFKGINLRQIGRDVIQGLINGITSMVGNAVRTVSDLAGNVIGAAKSIFGIRSPSRVFAEFGAYISEGLSNGVDDDASMAIRSVSALSQSMTRAFNPNMQLSKTDYAGQLNGMSGKLKQQLSSQVSSQLTVEKQPARITVVLGNQEIERFVDDINQVNAVNSLIRRF